MKLSEEGKLLARVAGFLITLGEMTEQQVRLHFVGGHCFIKPVCAVYRSCISARYHQGEREKNEYL
jgi:hypothetical protein